MNSSHVDMPTGRKTVRCVKYFSMLFTSIVLMNGIAPDISAAAEPRVIFSDDFEDHDVGQTLGDVLPLMGERYVDHGPTAVVATESLAGVKNPEAVGEHCAICTRQSVFCELTAADAAAVKDQIVRFRFDLLFTGEGAGGADIQTFVGTDPESSRAFNLLIDSNGQISYYARGTQPVGERVPVGEWVSFDLLADYKNQIFKVKIGEVDFTGRFDKKSRDFTNFYIGKFGEANYYFDNIRVEIATELAKELEGVAAQIAVTDSDLLQNLEQSESPFNVGTASQLFVDRLLVRDSERIWFTQHKGNKHPANPVLKPEFPWEGWRCEIFGNVIFDEQEQIFKMWYLPEEGPNGEYFDETNVTCYAVSKDGVHWEKPLVGTLKSKNGKPHNAVAHVFLPSVIKDMHDPDASRRYKCIGWSSRPPGYNTFVSPDGLNWTLFSETPIAPGGDVMTGYWDENRKLYVAFPKIHPLTRGHNRRQFGTMFSPDFKYWTNPVLSFTVDQRDDAGTFARLEQVRPILDRVDHPQLMRTEYYGIGAYTAESCTLAFPWILSINNNARYGNHEGPQEIQLAVSRDLIHWERPFRTPVIEIGELDQWDASYHTTAATALRVGDEVWLYYSGANYTHGTPVLYRETFEDGTPTGRKGKYSAAIGLVTWPLDRFVSADAGSDGGTLTTIPVRYSGDRLEINANVKPDGHIIVELLDGAGRPLEGVTASEKLSGDGLRHSVQFAGTTDLSVHRGQPVSLRFKMKNAELYSFAFRGDGDVKTSLLPKTHDKLANHKPLKIACLGDSVTGIYYHTGGRRAYPEMIPFALKAADPQIDVTVVNAGISGNTTVNGLDRLERDVLKHKPDLVTVMFTLNDMTRIPLPDFEANLQEIIERCRDIGAEVVLCTTNGVIDTPGRPIIKLLDYNVAIKKLGEKLSVPVCDIYAAYEKIKENDPLKFRLLMSDEIHPNMDGHKINAEVICKTLTGKDVSIAELGPEQPGLPFTASKIKGGEAVRVLAMTPYDKAIAAAFKTAAPEAKVEVVAWETEGKTLAQLEQDAKTVRNASPRYDFVFVGVPLAVTPDDENLTEAGINSYLWTLNWSLSFAIQEWDFAAATPAVLKPISPEDRGRNRFARNLIHAQHVNLVDRPKESPSSAEEILTEWLTAQLKSGK
ncbi:MAG: GDSL-type esterase/lipase family protein [Planctomycetaceae bacterium]